MEEFNSAKKQHKVLTSFTLCIMHRTCTHSISPTCAVSHTDSLVLHALTNPYPAASNAIDLYHQIKLSQNRQAQKAQKKKQTEEKKKAKKRRKQKKEKFRQELLESLTLGQL